MVMASERQLKRLEDDYDDDDENEDTQKNKFLTFRLGNEHYGLEIKYVTEIIGIQKITEVPDMPGFIKGVINLRGKIIPVMDVRLKFSMEERDYDERTCIVVVNVDLSSVGLVVDEVNEVVDIPENQIEPPPLTRKGEKHRYVQGMGKIDEEVKILLDASRLLGDDLADFNISDDSNKEEILNV